ncbi:TolC family protein [Lacibacter luteus]|uniref:TolC family protein n=1 Tax=Lacibacter luteus TaxID=2508719 RepID=A0A4V1M7F6_9BACT|nr:TolC family protein [Lacibacter luteus]RXK59702.1 TolC family protein [Lacibacter luteus]
MKKKTTRNKWLVFALLLLGFTTTQAQTEYRLTVKDAVDLALKNVADLKNLRIDSAKQEAQNKEIVGSALPQVSGSAQVAHYLTLPKVLFPSAGRTDIYTVLNQEGVKDGSGNTIAAKQEFSVQEFSFVQPWNVTAGVSLNQLLFQPDVFVGLIARKTSIAYATENIKIQEDKTREQVQKAYYQVLIAEQQLEVLQVSLQRFQKLLSDQEQLFKNGFIEKLDIDKTTVSFNNTKSTETQLKNMIELGYAALKFSMGLSQGDKIVLTEKLSTQTVKENILDDGSFNYNNRGEVRLLNTVQKLQELDVKRHRLGYLPTLAFFYQFQQQGMLNKNFSAFTGQNWFWFNSNLVGLNLSVPIFDGMQRKYKIQQAKYTLDKTTNTLDNVKKAIDLEKTSAQINLRNAILNMDAQQKNLELAERVYNTTKKKYEQGVGSSFEVLQADTELQRAQGNYFDALYNAVVARINYFKAIGQLN